MKTSQMTDEEVIRDTTNLPWAIRPTVDVERNEPWHLSDTQKTIIVLTDIRRLLHDIKNIGMFFVVVFLISLVLGLIAVLAH